MLPGLQLIERLAEIRGETGLLTAVLAMSEPFDTTPAKPG